MELFQINRDLEWSFSPGFSWQIVGGGDVLLEELYQEKAWHFAARK